MSDNKDMVDQVMNVVTSLWQGMSDNPPDDAPKPKFKLGDNVYVLEGKFGGAVGTIDSQVFYDGLWLCHMTTHDGSLGGGLFAREDHFGRKDDPQ